MQVERPRVALNAQLLRLDEGYRSAGIARYIYHLLRELGTAAGDFDLSVYATERHAPALLPRMTVHATRMAADKPFTRIVWEQTLFAWELLQKGYALLHSLAYVSPLLNQTRSVVTLYDLSFYLYPEYFRPFQRFYLQWGARISARRAQRLIVISASTKRDAVRLLHADPERIDVVTPGVEPVFFNSPSAATLDQFRRAHQLPEHFILFLGTREPRKNIPTLIHAFAQAKRAAHLPHQLVLAGGRGWLDEPVAQAIEQAGLTQDVILPGFVPQAELPLWYRTSDVFVYPSQYEGFGMPPLEALACGTPVITSNVSSLPEAVGDAALLVDPRDTAQLADALVRVLTDAPLRADLQARGPLYARNFTWTRAAAETATTYRRALDLEPAATAAVPAGERSAVSVVPNSNPAP